jgi:predicted Ser/Thr protein kinase
MSREQAIPKRVGRYVVERPLGQGGMGSVLLARDEQLGRAVAIKLPRSGKLSPGQRERFEREARAAAAITHPNVCPVYDVGDHEGRPYIAMAYVDGPILSTLIDPKHPLDQRRAVELVLGIANGLAAAHRAGVVHRDVKPLNVVLDERGEPILMDFGLARIVQHEGRRATREGDVLGTPAYMAPEQVDGAIHDIGFHTDVYALGIVLYELLTGRLPFVGSFETIKEEIRRGDPTPLVQHRPEVDPALAALCARAMSVDPADRFETATEFAAAADQWLHAEARVTRVEGEGPADTVTFGSGTRRSKGGGTTTSGVRTEPGSTRPLSAAGESAIATLARRPVMIGSIAGGVLLVIAVLVFARPWFGGGEKLVPPVPPPDPVRNNGVSTAVFNGRDLAGWTAFERVPNGARPRAIGDEGWAVEEGVLKCLDGEHGLLVLPDEYGVFELEMEILIPEGAGIEFQLRRNPGGESRASLMVPIVDGNVQKFVVGTRVGRRPPGERSPPDAARLRALHDFLARFATIGPLLKPAGEWNRILIKSVPRRVTVDVNGEQAVDLELGDRAVFKELPVVGQIALMSSQASNGIAIRTLRIRPIRRGE